MKDDPLHIDLEDWHERKPACPKCKRSDTVKPIAYGLLKRAPEGVILGGCIENDDEQFFCVRCHRAFGPRELHTHLVQ